MNKRTILLLIAQRYRSIFNSPAGLYEMTDQQLEYYNNQYRKLRTHILNK